MNDATLTLNGTRPSVRLERRLPDPPEVVWLALTEREQLREWFPCDVEVAGGHWEVGAAIVFRFPADVMDMTLSGEVLAVNEPKGLTYTWGDEVLSFELHNEGDGTRLVLTDELAPGFAARNAAGWEECLDRLVGAPPNEQSWSARFQAYTNAFEPVVGPQEGPPAAYKGKLS
jgi:uncharacterized protein YndB with AHSA1/START domain